MKTEFTRSNKDNVALSTLLAVTLFAIASGLVTSNPASASHAPVVVQKMDTILVTAPRAASVMLETIVVTAPRNTSHA